LSQAANLHTSGRVLPLNWPADAVFSLSVRSVTVAALLFASANRDPQSRDRQGAVLTEKSLATSDAPGKDLA